MKPGVIGLLKWAERQEEIIRNDQLSIEPEIVAMQRAGTLVARPEVLSHHVWALLAANLSPGYLDKCDATLATQQITSQMPAEVPFVRRQGRGRRSDIQGTSDTGQPP